MGFLKDVKTRFKAQGTNYSIDFDLTQLVAELDTKNKEVAEYILGQTQVWCPY